MTRISYECIVLWKKFSQASARAKLGKLQKIVELAISGAMRTTPTLAFNRILGLPSFHIRIEALARMSAMSEG